jgi:PAS domain-containing protein
MSETPPSPTEAATPPVESVDTAILRLLMENLPDRIYFKDLNSRFVRVNRAHAMWLGVQSPDDVIGKTDFDFFAQSHAQKAFMEEAVIVYTGRPPSATAARPGAPPPRCRGGMARDGSSGPLASPAT